MLRRWACAAAALAAAAATAACRGKPASDDAPASSAGSAGSAGSGSAARPAVPDQLTGTLTLDGKPLAMSRCRPGRDASIYVEITTPAGALRFVPYEPKLLWNGAPLDCADLQRSWGGGTRPDGTTYFRGRLLFSCTGAAGALAGDITLDCGDISPRERELLDDGRRRKLDELRGSGAAGGAAGSGG